MYRDSQKLLWTVKSVSELMFLVKSYNENNIKPILPFGALNGTNGACVGGGLVDVGVVALRRLKQFYFRNGVLYFGWHLPVSNAVPDSVYDVDYSNAK